MHIFIPSASHVGGGFVVGLAEGRKESGTGKNVHTKGLCCGCEAERMPELASRLVCYVSN